MHDMLTIVTDVHGVCLCHTVEIGGSKCSVHLVPCVLGHSVQPLPNAFGLLFVFLWTRDYSHHCFEQLSLREVKKLCCKIIKVAYNSCAQRQY